MQHPLTVEAALAGHVNEFAWPGGYTILYLMKDGGTLCASCVKENLEQIKEAEKDEDAQWQIADAYVHWEGPPEYCDHCNKEMTSEYGDPEEVERREFIVTVKEQSDNPAMEGMLVDLNYRVKLSRTDLSELSKLFAGKESKDVKQEH